MPNSPGYKQLRSAQERAIFLLFSRVDRALLLAGTGELVLDVEPLLVLVPDEDQSRYQCPHCSYSCTNRAYLQRHMRVHTGERPYRCDVCPSAFKDRSNLNRHRRCHTGEKPFKCPHCWRRFNQTSSLRTHVLGQHGTSRWR
ncbi:hypothetical protein HPB47_025562 [Ixodes persulcatus]|uniref:Uncharacterized protein n=1 Tax=Ixodes persulcatus TaxID=34615 RepID=A0AC60Q2D1_IXOPE|nr:hypothetical protein HPB47_025562 [Ixodes persulcatus]